MFFTSIFFIVNVKYHKSSAKLIINSCVYKSGPISENGSDADESAEVDQRPLVVRDGARRTDALRLAVGDVQSSGPDVSFKHRLASTPSGHVPVRGGHLPGAERALSTQDWKFWHRNSDRHLANSGSSRIALRKVCHPNNLIPFSSEFSKMCIFQMG